MNSFPSEIFVERRKRLLSQLSEGEGLLLFSQAKQRRNANVFYPYRQSSDFFYLTGFEEPDSMLLLRPSLDPESILFVPPKDENIEKWEGIRFGPLLAQKTFKLDAVYSNEEIENKLPSLLKPLDTIYCEFFSDFKNDLYLREVFSQVLDLKGRNEKFLPVFKNSSILIGEMRLFKSAFEIENIRKSTQISTQAHKMVMKNCFPGQNENTLHALFLCEIMKQGAKREAYPAIVASGENACILHYTANQSVLKKGELLLVDAGAEYNYYAADITRTYPVSGKFSIPQKRIYSKLLEIQKNMIQSVKPGIHFYDLQSKTISLLVDLLLDEKILGGKKDKIISSHEYRKFYPHGIGHWLGMDVQDVGALKKDKKERLLEENMCLTIEPGLYIPKDTSWVDKDLRGAGFRIEDDVLITQKGSETLSMDCPKEIDELEEIVGSQKG